MNEGSGYRCSVRASSVASFSEGRVDKFDPPGKLISRAYCDTSWAGREASRATGRRSLSRGPGRRQGSIPVAGVAARSLTKAVAFAPLPATRRPAALGICAQSVPRLTAPLSG